VLAPGRTARLTIEPIDQVHADGLFTALDDVRVGTYIGGPDVTTVDELRARITRKQVGPPAERNEQWHDLAVIADGVIVGRVEATVHHGVAEVAYVFGPAYWGRGFAVEATTWMIDQLRAEGVATFWATVVPDNAGSVRLLERLGFRQAEPDDGLTLWSYDPGDLTYRLD
jgi:RimJ/RimL family protein N-acetyltransferase